MVSKYRLLGTVWPIRDYLMYRGKRYKFANYHFTFASAKKYIKESDWDGYSKFIHKMLKTTRRKKNVVLYVVYRRKFREPTTKPFDWNDPENIRRYNLR